MSLVCLDTLVGLSSIDYQCFEDTRPDGYNVSDSGYFLTDTDYGLTIVDQCTISGWTMLSNAMAQSIRETKSDLRASLREKYDSSLSPFSGHVGQLKNSGTMSATGERIGIRIRAKNKKGVKEVVKRIFLGLNTSGVYNVQVTSSDPLFVAPDPIAVTVVANNFATSVATLATPLELPFYSDACQGGYIDYFLSIERGSALPLNNKFKCCGNNPSWQNHMEVAGFEGSSAAPDSGSFSGMAYGFVLDAYLACDELDWICQISELGGYSLLDVIARTIQFRGAAIAISALIDTMQVNPCTGYQLENLNSKRAYLNKRYSDNISWVTENLPSGATDCFACKPANQFTKAKILI